MNIHVRIPTALRAHTGGASQLALALPPRPDTVPARVADVLEHLCSRHPSLRSRVLTADGRPYAYLGLFVNGVDVRELDHELSPVRDGDTLTLLPAIAGG